MAKERKWWSIPRAPSSWWRRPERGDVSRRACSEDAGPTVPRATEAVYCNTETKCEGSTDIQVLEQHNSDTTNSVKDLPAVEAIPSISFSFFNEVDQIMSSTTIDNMQPDAERKKCDGSSTENIRVMSMNEENNTVSEGNPFCEGGTDVNTLEIPCPSRDCVTSSENIQVDSTNEETLSIITSNDSCAELNGLKNSQMSYSSPCDVENIEICSQIMPEGDGTVESKTETSSDVNNVDTGTSLTEAPNSSDNGYEVLRIRPIVPVESTVISSEDIVKRLCETVENTYALPRGSCVDSVRGSIVSSRETTCSPIAWDSVEVANGDLCYEELEYCEHRAGQRRATLMRPRVVKVRARVGRAWRAVRIWWREERVRLSEAVQRHAHEQAVQEPPQEPPLQQEPSEEKVYEVVKRRRRETSSRPVSRAGLTRSRYIPEGQNGFEELRRYIKQGGDFCKDLSSILQERSEAETQYAKSLSKLSCKLLKASKDSVGTVTQAWQRAGAQMEAQSDAHRAFAAALSEEVVKPLRQLVESQHRIRKSVEVAVDKTSKSLSEWRSAEAKSKKQSFVSARENEKLQDAMLDVRLGRGHLHHTQNHKTVSDKESAKLESKRRKAEEAVKKADVEYYTFCIRAERARLEWETAVIRGSHCFQALEEERLQQLKGLATGYLHHLQELGPKLVLSTDRLTEPVESCDVARDIQTVVSIKGTGQPIPEQLLPDFYAEHITLAMNRERRRQALVKLLQLIRQDLERERRGKQGVESLARALQQTPTFGAEDSQQNLTEKLHHMRSMLTYLEAARYKVQSALAELDGRTRGSHPLASHIQVTRDRQGLQQSVLKVPPWVRKESLDQLAGDSPDWTDRGAGDGNSVQPDSDFDEFSSQGSEKDYQSSVMTYPVISECSEASAVSRGRCKALYEYAANLYDELNLRPGDVINIHDKQADGWWLGELNGVVGIFPATYVEEMK